MGKKVLVTGAGGYIGRHVVTALCDLGAQVSVIDFCTEEIDQRAIRIFADLFSGSSSIFQDVGCPDVCLHLAWKDGFVHHSHAHMQMLSKHYVFLRDMIEGGLAQLTVMGTMHEVGYFEGSINEDVPCNPINMYGIAKDALRRSMFLLAQNNRVCLQWLRAYYIYGDDKRNNSIFAKIARAEEEGKAVFPFTSGKNKYDFIDVGELACQIAATVMQTQVDGIINCCTGKPVRLADKVESFIAEHGYKITLQYGAFPERPYDSPGVWGDATKIERIMRSRKR